MNNFEKPNNIIEFPRQSNDSSAGNDIEPFDRIRAENERYLAKLKNEAKQYGKESFDVEKMRERYYPNDTSDDENEILSRIKNLEMDYYLSGAMTISEFVGERERYDEIKDSTGHDDL